MRRRLFAFVLFFLVCSVSVSSAQQILQADQCTISSEQTILGNLFVTCRTLTIDGIVEGDVIGAAATSDINGNVRGSVYLLGGQLDVYGTIGGDLHFAGPVLRIHSDAHIKGGDLFSVTLSTVSQDSIPGGVVAAGYELILEGNVGREVDFWGSSLTIDGRVGGDVNATVGDPQSAGVAELRALLTPANVELKNPGLYITENGMVNGQLTYRGPVAGEILADLPNEPVFEQMITQADLPTLTESEDIGRGINAYFSQVLREFLTLTLVGVITFLLVPRALQAPIPTLQMRLLPSLGVGLIAFILSFPVFLIVILLTVIIVLILSLLQLPELTFISSLIAAVFDFSTIGLFYFIAFMITRVIVALALGRFIIRRLIGNPANPRMGIIGLLLGIAIVTMFASLPLVGFLVSAIAVFLGLGAILIMLQEELEKSRAAPVPVPVDSVEAQQVPPPMVEDTVNDPGTENLPEGFKWWN